jgi:hypothetical protein
VRVTAADLKRLQVAAWQTGRGQRCGTSERIPVSAVKRSQVKQAAGEKVTTAPGRLKLVADLALIGPPPTDRDVYAMSAFALSGNPVRIQAVTIREEEIFDVSLAAFSLLDKENVRAQRLLAPPDKMAWGGCVPGGLYYSETSPTIGRPVYQTPGPVGHRQIRPSHKHVRRKP